MHTIIVGGGFAGVKAALELSKQRLGKITLISDEPYFLHHDTLYQAATGHDTSSVTSLEDIFATHREVTIVRDRMKSVDPARKLVVCDGKDYRYDTLIIAIGNVAQGIEKYSYGIKTLDQVRAFKRHIHDEAALNRHMDKKYVIIGAGPTGVELAGALGAYLLAVARSHEADKAKMTIMLVEEKSRILPDLSKMASKKAAARLRGLGVKVITSHKVDALAEDYIVVGGKKIPTKTVIWTSGTISNSFFAAHQHDFELNSDGKVVVGPYLEAQENIYVLGDSVALPYTGHARTALRHAKFVAQHLKRKAVGQSLRSYRSRSVMVSVPIGEKWAYVEKYGVYAAGKTGYFLYRLNELFRLRSLLPHSQAMRTWHAQNVRDGDCEVCGL